MDTKQPNLNQDATTDSGKYPGIAVNEADKNDVTTKLEKERTTVLNNNPRNGDGPQPDDGKLHN